MGKMLLFIILYIALPPFIIVGGKVFKNYMKTALFGRRRSKTAIAIEAEKEGLSEKISKRVKFTMSDSRKDPVPFKIIFIAIYVAGLMVSAIAGLMNSFKIFLFSLVIAYGAITFAYVSANKIVSARDEVLKRMLELKGTKMKHLNRGAGKRATINNELKVIEWSEDLVNPAKMHIYMPTDFDIMAVDSFLQSFNLIFGSQGQWVADKGDKDYGGFDFNKGVAAIKVTPPLPQLAKWHTRYLNPEKVHWSFFPLAIGSENGIPIYNEETGRVEPVLGFSVNSGQNKLSAKNGDTIGDEIVAAPQILVGGGTGGGKSLHVETPVEIVIDDK